MDRAVITMDMKKNLLSVGYPGLSGCRFFGSTAVENLFSEHPANFGLFPLGNILGNR